ncbi:MAG: chemotaxis protein CheW [Verrucomicrobiota bacterium]
MKTDTPATHAHLALQKLAGKYLTFQLGRESYGIPVLKVREIIRLVPITAVPQTLCFIKGVINLRGKIIPVLDLRLRFGLSSTGDTESTCIVVVQVKRSSDSQVQMGLIVDAVEEVCLISAADIEESPDFGKAVETEYILGMAKLKGLVKILLDIERVVGCDTQLPTDPPPAPAPHPSSNVAIG